MFVLIYAVLFLSWLFIEVSIIPAGIIYKNIYRIIDKNNKNYYIYMLGGSTAAGEPYGPTITAAKIVKYMFDGTINGKEIKIIQIAKPGQPVEYNYWRLYKELFFRPKKNGAILLYSGINDVVGRPDANNIPKSWIVPKSLILLRLRFLFEHQIEKPINVLNFLNSDTIEYYRFFFRRIIKLGLSYDLHTVVSTLVANFSDFDPETPLLDWYPEWIAIINRAKMLEGSKMYNEALELYQEIENKYDDDNDSYIKYKIGKCYENLKEFTKAKEYYWMAVEKRDPRRPNFWQNKLIEDLSKEYNIGFADTYRYYEQATPNGLIGYNLIMDAHHPNLKGYILMAQAFADELERITGETIKRGNPTETDIIRYFKFNSGNEFDVYFSRFLWLCGHSEFAAEPEERIKKAEEYMEKAKDLFPDDPRVSLGYFIFETINGNKDKAFEWIRNGQLFTENSDIWQDIRVIRLLRAYDMDEQVAKRIKELSSKND